MAPAQRAADAAVAPKLTPVDWERMQLAETEARQRLYTAITRQPELLKLWTAWQQAERALVDAGRARREGEAHGG